MENLAILIFTIFMIATMVSLVFFIIGIIKKDFKLKPSKKIIIICILGFIGSTILYGVVQTPETKIRIAENNKAKAEQKALEKAEKEREKAEKEKQKELEKAEREKQKEEAEKLAEELVKEESVKEEAIVNEVTTINKKEPSENEKKDFNVDWEKCIQETKEELTNSEFFSYVKDIYIEVKEDEIKFTAALADSTSDSIALDFADTLIRRFNLTAKAQDNAIKSSTKDYLGGLYDKYNIVIAIAPLSKVSNQKEWYVYDAISKGMHRQPRLKKK